MSKATKILISLIDTRPHLTTQLLRSTVPLAAAMCTTAPTDGDVEWQVLAADRRDPRNSPFFVPNETSGERSSTLYCLSLSAFIAAYPDLPSTANDDGEFFTDFRAHFCIAF
jgi:hypothetical protein